MMKTLIQVQLDVDLKNNFEKIWIVSSILCKRYSLSYSYR